MHNKKFVLVIVLLIICVVAGCARKASSPEQAFYYMKNAVLKNDWDRYWELLSSASCERFDAQVNNMQEQFGSLPASTQERILASLDVSRDEFEKLDGRRFFITYIENNAAVRNQESYTRDLFESSEVIDVDVNGDEAVITIEDEKGHQEKIPAVYEKNGWKLDFFRYYSF